jgi:hypothetical protein
LGLDASARLVAAAGTAVAKDIRLAGLLISARAAPAVADLADPSATLKSLLHGTCGAPAASPALA